MAQGQTLCSRTGLRPLYVNRKRMSLLPSTPGLPRINLLRHRPGDRGPPPRRPPSTGPPQSRTGINSTGAWSLEWKRQPSYWLDCVLLAFLQRKRNGRTRAVFQCAIGIGVLFMFCSCCELARSCVAVPCLASLRERQVEDRNHMTSTNIKKVAPSRVCTASEI